MGERSEPMNNPFLSEGYILPIASLNRVRLFPFRGAPAEIEGKAAGALLSGQYFHGLVKSLGDRGIAAKELGENLAYLLLTLKAGLPEAMAARPDWSAEHWEYWAKIEKVILCGGLSTLSGTLLAPAHETFAQSGGAPYEVEIARRGEMLSLIGAGRTNPGGVALDFGHSFVKRARFNGPGFIPLSQKPAAYTGSPAENSALLEEARRLHSFIVDTVLETLGESGDADSASIIFANYVRGGALNPGRGGYAKLSLLADNYAALILDELSARLERPVRIRLFHDGTAAAMAVNESKPAAVISLGTGLGVGFVS